MKAYGLTGRPILGTLERCPGRAEVQHDSFERNPDGSLEFEYSGSTEYFYDDQRTVTRKGLVVFLDDEGSEWTSAQVILSEDDFVSPYPLKTWKGEVWGGRTQLGYVDWCTARQQADLGVDAAASKG